MKIAILLCLSKLFYVNILVETFTNVIMLLKAWMYEHILLFSKYLWPVGVDLKRYLYVPSVQC